MFQLISTNKNKTFFIGDIHGEFKAIGYWIKNNCLKNCNLIFCGDFGLGFSSVEHEQNTIKKSNDICEEYDVDCYIIRGNHDDPSYYNTNTPKLNLSRFKTVSDYTVIQTPCNNILCVGGAVSVDRKERISRYKHNIETLVKKRHCSIETAREKVKPYWWNNEAFVYDEDILDEIHKSGITIDCIATHTAPDFCQPFTKGLYWTRLDSTLEIDLTKERLDCTRLYKKITSNNQKIKYWFYGHYHTHNYEIIEGTRFVGLDMARNGKQGYGTGSFFDMTELVNKPLE